MCVHYIILFIEGIIAFISPCVLPLLPAYVSYFAAGEANRQTTLKNVLGFSLGFKIVFLLLGAFAGTIGSLLRAFPIAVNIVTGLIVVLLGLNYLGVIKIKFLNRSTEPKTVDNNLRFYTSVLFGITYAITWTPFAGAFLGSALLMASQQGGVIEGAIMLFVFSFGLSIPFVLSALLIDKVKGAFEFIKKNYKVINTASGILLVAIGILMATGIMGRIMAVLSF